MHKVLLLIVVPLLSYGFWLSDAFKGIAAGVSIFLFGMLSLEQGFKAFTGGVLERILQKNHRYRLEKFRLWFSVGCIDAVQRLGLSHHHFISECGFA